MKRITEKLRRAALKKTKPFINQLVIEQLDRDKIIHAAKQYAESQINTYYDNLRQPTALGLSLRAVRAKVGTRADSKAEIIFYYLMEQNGITFKFQYPIGPYTADYLINDYLVVELDGPRHNKTKDGARDEYMRRMGYSILRVPLWVLSIDPDAVIEEIKGATTK